MMVAVVSFLHQFKTRHAIAEIKTFHHAQFFQEVHGTVDGREIDLTPTEFKLLLLLAERKGRVQPRNLLLETVWEAAPDIQTRTVDMHVQRLRAKLGPAGDLIETVRGFGYRIKNVSERS